MFGWTSPYTDHGWVPYSSDFSTIPTAEFMDPKPWIVCPGGWSFGAGQHFIASRKRIHKNPVDMYKKIQKFCMEYIDPTPVGHLPKHYGTGMMEAIWRFIL
jgi:hypothetical protein